ncbi:hypothetical protein Ddye_014862 [Dipteronia dyeriana]|uniref:non-specific serine/threonine protein kinase n=1 Tax=Dipteronia dyeriana TaxID=168575 RepID=A0AAD9WYM1_9ROSI|nr:hypothetical protein Ddye_014862 [Dipteronia dyeriana]
MDQKSDENYLSTFTETVKQKNPSVKTLLSSGGPFADYSLFSPMLDDSLYRKSFIDSSITTARRYGFEGLDFNLKYVESASDMSGLSILIEEWRAAVTLEARNSSKSELILTAVVDHSPDAYSLNYPINSMQQYLNWIHVGVAGRSIPVKSGNFTAAPSALFDPTNTVNIDNEGLSADKLVLSLSYYGFAWKLVNSADNGIGAPAKGPALSKSGFMEYSEIKNYIEAIRDKVSYAKEKGLLGYRVWQVSYDPSWVLSQAADQDTKSGQNKRPHRFLVIIFPITAAFTLLLGLVIFFWRMRKPKSKESVEPVQESRSQVYNATAAGDFNGNSPALTLYSLADIETATDKFSIENKLGEGGYGPVYKGVLQDGLEVAVKKLSKTSIQGFEEFKNEVMLTAKLQHVNLVRLLGFCIDREEHMLIYEYMSNKSLDYYLFGADPVKKFILDWKKRIHIIQGVCQGFLYLQEYSRLTIIYRDLKASNVLLDEYMKPKIFDFGVTRIFTKDDMEPNTGRIVGTFIIHGGFAPPEYVLKDIYSTKFDVIVLGFYTYKSLVAKGSPFCTVKTII